MPLFSFQDLEAAHATVQQFVPETPAYAWPLLKKRTGVDVFVKHENHTPTGSFKARGGFTYVDALIKSGKKPTGLVTATRGNHGQSIALSAARNGIPSYIVVPEGNSQEKNDAMRAFGANVIIAGKDFDESRALHSSFTTSRATTWYHPSMRIWSKAFPPMPWSYIAQSLIWM
ncbi:pyridoxal-phosphate dependent enzyme [Sulfitobacter sp. S45]|uniref:pyridoxal-phosphate dependent enzyme n=1 Tax=Sulfitobacter sp. S45 TaxID=3368581 RepID=UPI0037465BC0